MSDLAEKLEAPKRDHGGRPEARADQLLARWGSERVSDDRISITYSGHSELWVRAVGTGLKAMYHRIETAPEGANESHLDSHQH